MQQSPEKLNDVAVTLTFVVWELIEKVDPDVVLWNWSEGSEFIIFYSSKTLREF